MKMYQVSTGYMGATAYKIFEVEVERATAHFVTIKGQKHKTVRSSVYCHFVETKEDAIKLIEELLTISLSSARSDKERAERNIAHYEKELKDLKDGKFGKFQ
jgi:hypothetical protein